MAKTVPLQITVSPDLVAFPCVDVAGRPLLSPFPSSRKEGLTPKAQGHVQNLMTWDDYRGRPQKLPDQDRDGVPEPFYHRRCPGSLSFAIEQVASRSSMKEEKRGPRGRSWFHRSSANRPDLMRELDPDGIAGINYKWSDQWYGGFSDAQTATELAGS